MSNKDKKVIIDLSGPEGNAYALMSYAKTFSLQIGLDHKSIIEEMKESTYDNLVNVFEKYFGEFVTILRD